MGRYPEDLDSFDFAAAEEDLRALLFGRDDWLVSIHPIHAPLNVENVPGDTHLRVCELATPYLTEIPVDLHATWLNWAHVHLSTGETDFEEVLEAGLRNILSHGNARFRHLASSALAHLKVLDRFHSGEGGVCRITWGASMRLDDCTCQTISIGALQFSAVDYGDVISLNESMKQRLTAIDKEERNKCTLLAIAAGIIACDLKHKTAPPRNRVARLAAELRLGEWQAAHPLTQTKGNSKSPNEKTMMSLCHDLVYPNHDRDYRSLALFLAPYLMSREITVRVFDVLRSGNGETALEINIIGDINTGTRVGFVDIMAPNGHMRLLQPSNETLPCAWRDWLNALSDFVVAFPLSDVLQVLDENRDVSDNAPWLTCRQCRRGEKIPPGQSSFYRSHKLTDKWPEAIISENAHTGGYPSADPTKHDPPNTTFPMVDYNWRGTTAPCDLVPQFFRLGAHDFARSSAEQVALKGDALIEQYGSLRMDMRAVQESKMADQEVLATNAREHLKLNPELQQGDMELHKLGAIPKYRGPTPGNFRVRGFPRNPIEEGYIMGKLRGYVQQGKMFVCSSQGIAPGDLFMVSPSTTVPKKLHDGTISVDSRVIWDGRRLNLKCPKGDYWHVVTPTVGDLARRYCHIKTTAPGIEMAGAKRDTDAAFARCRVHPDCAAIFGTEFTHTDPTNSLVFFYLVLPFGFTGSP